MKTTTLEVRWLPSVRKVTVFDDRKRSNNVAEDKESTVVCEVQMGRPEEPESSVRATIGERKMLRAAGCGKNSVL